MESRRKKYDRSLPGTRELVDRIVHGVFAHEGTFVAFPLCFPGATTAIPPDESRVTALTMGPRHMVYGGTSGRAAHVFVGMFHGVTGSVIDFGVVPGATETTAVCALGDRWVAACNGPGGGFLVRGNCQPLPFDLIQEWFFALSPPEMLGSPVPGERIVHAVAEPGGQGMLVMTERHLVRWSAEDGKVRELTQLATACRMVSTRQGLILAARDPLTLGAWDPAKGHWDDSACVLPGPLDMGKGLRWAVDPTRGDAYVGDGAGRLFRIPAGVRRADVLARAPLSPITSLAAVPDGRVFGTCGEGMEHFFVIDPSTRDLRDIGMAVSVLERRRYGYVFADAVTGRDGQIYFAENDDLGHLWIYFPAIRPA